MHLLDVLQTQFPDSSKTTLRKMLQSDRVRVNGVVERDAKREISQRDQVEVGSSAMRRLDPRIRILHLDDDLVVVEKPAGMLTVGNISESDSVESMLNTHFGAKGSEARVHVVQRLDFDTSGVIVFARNADMRQRLQKLFERHDIERVYVAIIHGRMDPPNGTIRSFLAEGQGQKMRSTENEERGKEAITHYRTKATGPRFSLLEVTLETGRRNQIRVHLSESGHPIVGDTMYGRDEPQPLRRLALHARDLGFVHPRTRQKVRFTSELPPEMARLRL